MWARADTAPLFVPARDMIVAALEKGPMTVSGMAREIGRDPSTVKSALRRHLLPNGKVIRTEFNTYALAGTRPPYISKCDAIVAALKNGHMTFQALVREVGSTQTSLPQFLDLLLAKGKIIRIARGMYALAGTAPVFVTTSDAITGALSKQAMRLRPLIQHVSKLPNIGRSRSAVISKQINVF